MFFSNPSFIVFPLLARSLKASYILSSVSLLFILIYKHVLHVLFLFPKYHRLIVIDLFKIESGRDRAPAPV